MVKGVVNNEYISFDLLICIFSYCILSITSMVSHTSMQQNYVKYESAELSRT